MKPVFDPDAFHGSVEHLIRHAEAVLGLFQDAVQGWLRFHATLNDILRLEVERGRPFNDALEMDLIHGHGKPEDGLALHRSTFGATLARCNPDGSNEHFLASMCLVSIFGVWEGKTRGDIAAALCIHVNDVHSDLFGDLRVIRHCILHTQGIADSRVERCKVLEWFKRGQAIVIDREKLRQVVNLVRELPTGIRTPAFRPPELESQPVR